MKHGKRPPKPADKKSVWQKTQYANLIRYVPSGVYYARFRVRGKLLWKSLKTDAHSTEMAKRVSFSTTATVGTPAPAAE